MTAKQLISARLSPATRQRLDDLVTAYGTQAEVIAVAVDRLHTATFPPQPEPVPAGELVIGQRVTVAGWPQGTVDAIHRIGQHVNGVRIRFDSGAVLVVKPEEVSPA